MMDALLDIQKLKLGFQLWNGYVEVLHSIDLQAFAGEKIALVGESGSGKSVTARCILGLIDQSHAKIDGSIFFQGKDTTLFRPKDWKGIRGGKISMIFQDPMNAMNPTFTIGEQIAEVMLSAGTVSQKQEAFSVASDAMRKISIEDPERILNSYCFQLSGGLNQRVMIIMALLNKPALLLADEPGTALDVTVQMQTLDLMQSMTQELNTATLLISHNLGVVREFADYVYVMHKGRIVESGMTDDVFHNPQHPYTCALMEAVPKLSGGINLNFIYDEQSFYDTAPFQHTLTQARGMTKIV